MTYNRTSRKEYTRPSVEVVDMACEGVLCQSGTAPKAWYDLGSEGDFTYQIGTIDSWE